MFVITIVLVIISLTAQLIKYIGGVEDAYRLIPTMDVDRELSVPSKYSVMLLFSLALLTGVISILKYRAKDVFRWQWLILALGFLFMTFDEGSSIHELVVMPVRQLIGEDVPGFLLFSWVIPAGVIVVFLFFFFLRFLLSLPKRTTILLIVSACIYLIGSVVMEMIGANYASQEGVKNLPYNIGVTFEEMLEMSGLITAFYALLDYVDQTLEEIKLSF